MFVSVSGCSFPDAFSLSAKVSQRIFSASAYFPWLLSVCARLLMLVSVSGCFFPNTFSQCQRLSVHLLGLGVLPLVAQCLCQIMHARQRLRMLLS